MQAGSVDLVLGIAEHEDDGLFRLERREDGLGAEQENDDDSQKNVSRILAHYFCTSVCGASAFWAAGAAGFVFSCVGAARVGRGR